MIVLTPIRVVVVVAVVAVAFAAVVVKLLCFMYFVHHSLQQSTVQKRAGRGSGNGSRPPLDLVDAYMFWTSLFGTTFVIQPESSLPSSQEPFGAVAGRSLGNPATKLTSADVATGMLSKLVPAGSTIVVGILFLAEQCRISKTC